MTRTPVVLFVGYNAAYLRAVEGKVPQGSIVVLEEPDIIRKRNLGDAAIRWHCVDRVVAANYQQSDDVLDIGLDLAKRDGVLAVVPGLEYAVVGAARLAAKLGLPGAGEAAASALRDKLQLREMAERAGVRNPRWREISGPDDIMAFADGGAVVVKPANRQASVGVVLLDRVDEELAHDAWQRTTTAGEFEQVPDRDLRWRYAVEERLRGPEFSVEVLVQQGVIVFDNVTAKTVMPGPHPVELGHVMPAPLAPSVRTSFVDAMIALVAGLGFENGILHGEWILTGDGPTLVECAGRCPGDHIVDLVDLAYDTSIRLTLIDLLADRPVRLPRTAARAASIRFLAPDSPGEVLDVLGAEEARRLPGVFDVEVDVAPGSVCRPWASSWDRAGHIIATGENAAAAQSHALAATATVRIVTTGAS